MRNIMFFATLLGPILCLLPYSDGKAHRNKEGRRFGKVPPCAVLLRHREGFRVGQDSSLNSYGSVLHLQKIY
jgi:hypothetical protein